MENYLNLEKLSNDLENLFQNQNQNENQNESYFDFEIICEENQISFKTHKSILSSRSHYFKTLFKSKMKEFQENKMILKDFSSSILFSILNYFYSGKIEINSENAIQILFFSSKYLVDELIEISSIFIKKNLQIENIIDVLKLSESMNLNQLLDFSYQFILENFEEFSKTSFFLELEENHLNSLLSNGDIAINEFQVFQSLIKWGKHKSNINQDKQKLKNQISNLIDKIRFIDFSKKELEDTLKEDLIPNEITQKLIEFQKLQNGKDERKLNQFIEKENSLIFTPKIKFKSKILQHNEHLQKLKEWINDNEFFYKMKLGYSARRDGFLCKDWHKKVDDQGKTLILIKTTENYIFGGFTEVGYVSGNPRFLFDPDAFIFTLRNPRKDPPQKLPVTPGFEDKAIYYHYDYGIYFGNDIRMTSYSLSSGYFNLGSIYALPEGIEYQSVEAFTYLTGSFDEWIVEEIECFFI
ncbi:hypothetical protein M0811_00481 [Anaeramoeba ignava]|uniref:Kelch-like protein 17 n=1 Tax=Anaeramoeba ignava TaxID=1746090 RepID=A0A9Q0LR26_ANAIG|nr:hypothetical protein M0811_00481 [Anaeramoeba ignava]